ncbi:AEC family transporter [Oceanospirillum maris]|uniref:AEC family transporter n=1 Tax=Oceanospirillum maris TaxID=64977 RepID=UPI00042A4ACC|nr:AEC family transporter [Oceanospirillum maris]
MLILDALVPVFMVIMVGTLFHFVRFPGGDFWPLVERFTYFFLFPAMLVSKMANAKIDQVAVDKIALAIILLLVAMTTLVVVLKPLLTKSGPAFTSIYQGGLRFNTYVVLAAAEALYGESGLTTAAVAMAIMIPLINVFCVCIFAVYVGQSGSGILATLKALVKNPLIVGCVVGMLLNVTGIGLPGWSAAAFSIVSNAALPLGLLAVGFALNLSAIKEASWPLISSSLLKLMVMPVVATLIGYYVGLSEIEIGVLLLFAAMPTATSSYILARQLGGHAPLMAAITTAQTLLAMITLPIVLQLLPNTLLRLLG